MKRNLLKLALVAVAVGAVVFLWMWNKPHKDYAGQSADAVLTAERFYADFSAAPDSMNLAYAEKVVVVEGVLQEHFDQTFLLAPGVAITMLSLPEPLPEPGAALRIKARVLSFDVVMNEVKLDNGVVEP
jgi:hypothetical protein